MDQVKQIGGMWSTFPKRAQMAALAIAVGTLLVLFFVIRTSTHTTWVPVSTGIKSGASGNITAALDKAKIKYQINASGSSVEVPRSALQKARVALAGDGVLANGNSHANYDTLLGKTASKYSMTTDQEKLLRQRLQEGLVASDIEQIDGIQSADVRLNVADQTLFSDESSKSTAAVTINTGGQGMTDKQVKAVTQLTASAVKALDPADVTVVDDKGNTSSGGDLAGGDVTGSSAQLKLRVEEAYNRKVEADVMRAIDRVAGPHKAIVMSNATLNEDKVTEAITNYGGDTNAQGPKGTEVVNSETMPTSTAGAKGAAGATSNVSKTTASNQYATKNGSATSNGYANTGGQITYNNDMIQSEVVHAQGALEAAHLSVIVDESVPSGTRNAIKNAVMAWKGTGANDTFSFETAKIVNASGVKDAPRAASTWMATTIEYLKWVLLGIGLIGLGFFVRRTLNQRTAELMNPGPDVLLLGRGGFDPVPLRELEAAVSAATSFDHQKRHELQRRAENIADSRPENVAQMLRGWLHEGDRNAR